MVTSEESINSRTFAQHAKALSSLYRSEEPLSAIAKAIASGEEFESRDAIAGRDHSLQKSGSW
jgi:hypothetical protein